MSGRGSTRLGRPASLPAADYAPPAPVRDEPGGLVVAFHGEDDRRREFRIEQLPLPGWHPAMAAAFAQRVGPAGGRRTLSSAVDVWGVLGRFLRFLATLPCPPATPVQLTEQHLDAFHTLRRRTCSAAGAALEVREVGKLLRLAPLAALVAAAVVDAGNRRWATVAPPGKPGYSDRALARLVTAARRDVRALRDRIDHSEHELRVGPDPALLALSATGVVRDERGRPGNGYPARRALAQQLFVTWPDVAPLLVLLVAVTGRNIETIKELPAEHRVLDERAVEVRLTKRRRGARNWTQTVTWEIGAPGRELHTPGGLYLLAHRLCARGRGFAESTGLWSVWRNGTRAGVTGTTEHHNPFTGDLGGGGSAQWARSWVIRHGLTGDTTTATGEPAPFVLDMTRLKTSIEARHTRAMGGHLPSAARSNTTAVLFRNYLRGDPSTQQWARGVIDEAVVDAETAALDAHRRVLAASGGVLQVHPDPGDPRSGSRARSGLPDDAARATSAAVDAAWSGCADVEHHPVTGTTCRASFLDCFHCGNCVITGDHLPRVLALLDALDGRRQQLPTDEWWARYGPVWAAITREVLPRFTPAQVDQAAAGKPVDALLDLVEQPWERP